MDRRERFVWKQDVSWRRVMTVSVSVERIELLEPEFTEAQVVEPRRSVWWS